MPLSQIKMSRVIRKPDFCLCENKGADQLRITAQISFAVTAKLISAFVFATPIVQSFFYLNLKFQASSRFLRLYRTGRFVPGLVGNPEDRFSHDVAQMKSEQIKYMYLDFTRNKNTLQDISYGYRSQNTLKTDL